MYGLFDAGMAVDDLILCPDPMGCNMYKMLKQIYGWNHLRTICFEMEEAQIGLQKVCGCAGGWGREEYTKPKYL